jgi:formate dehydrogenase subunit gamma
MTLVEDSATEVAPRPALVRRYEPVERFAHWWVVGCFAMTLLSGLSLGDDSGGAMSARLTWHIASAAALVAGLVLLPLLPGRRALWRSVRALAGFGAHSGTGPGGRKFNVGQQLAAYAFAALMAGIYVTGIAAVARGGGEGEGGPHGAVVAMMVVALAGHVFLAVIYPSTRPALRGMLTGWVDRTWAQRNHPGWLAQVERPEAKITHGGS